MRSILRPSRASRVHSDSTLVHAQQDGVLVVAPVASGLHLWLLSFGNYKNADALIFLIGTPPPGLAGAPVDLLIPLFMLRGVPREMCAYILLGLLAPVIAITDPLSPAAYTRADRIDFRITTGNGNLRTITGFASESSRTRNPGVRRFLDSGFALTRAPE